MKSAMKTRPSSRIIFFILGLFVFINLEIGAQIKPVYDQGALGLAQLLKRLNTSASAMMIGAHPDDEDTALLAYLARGENARTAYLSLTRGDGGQNIIGPEMGEALGVIRTEELLQARKLDGAEQFFTRAYDYGFSKTLDEAKQKWDEKIILCDAVRVIRDFRPLVVISQFSGTPADGHGQHQFAGYITPIAVKAAADASQCADAGPAWTVKKLYVRHGFRSTGEPRLRIDTGKFDALLGRSYFEIAMEARSQHRSQEQGVLELKGPQFSGLNLVGSEAKEIGIFDGLDTSIRAAGTGAAVESGALSEIQSAAEKAFREFDPKSPEGILPHLLKGYQAAHKEGLYVNPNVPSTGFARSIAPRFVDAIVDVLGLQVDALSSLETVAPGESFDVGVKAFSPIGNSIRVKDIGVAVPVKRAGASDEEWWTVKRRPAPTANTPAFTTREVGVASENFTVTALPDADVTTPYWLVERRQGDMLKWSGSTTFHGLPMQPSAPVALVAIEVNGVDLNVSRSVEYRFADDVRGEIRRPVAVVPAVSVSLDQDLMIVAQGAKDLRKFLAVTVTNNSSGPANGKIALSLPKGWTSSAGNPEFTLAKKGESTSIQFSVNIPRNTAAGSYQVGAAATVGGTVYSRTMRTIAYPHIQTHRFYVDAVAKANVIDLKTAPARIGYLVGSGDKVPQAIRQMGLTVETIDDRTLSSGDLSQFDVIVVGIRAYQVRSDIVSYNKRLLDFANAGGTLIVQYQLPTYAQQNLAPFPAQQGPRVSSETAKVKILDPANPIFNFPNRIADADFEGWVQERNLYNFSTMDSKYTGLLESHDANEAENKGGLVVADIGKGKYVYCSYSLFRQLPAGVPGAYRLLANMIAYRAEKPRK